MNLDDAQKRTVAEWIAQGQKLSEIQKRLADELGLPMTYMEVRLLVDDLKLTPKDLEPAKPDELSGKPGAPDSTTPTRETAEKMPAEEESPLPGAGNVSVRVDHLARPGAVVSGSVTFSDGQSAAWYLDQMGRLALAPKQQGYKPSQADLQTFQVELQNELAKMGF